MLEISMKNLHNKFGDIMPCRCDFSNNNVQKVAD